MQSMTHGSNGSSRGARPASSASSTSSGSSSKHVRCIGRYVLTGATLGKGNFARVEAAVHTLSRSKVAIKIIETDKIKEDYVRKNLLREAQLMRRLRHPNIIRLYETMKTNNLYCLVTEVAEGGELLSHVRSDFKEKRLPEATARPFIRQLVSALHHLHSSGIVHRDLKMENILLDRKKKNVKIVDFGLSNSQRPGSLLQTHCGSPEYAAPELFIPGREYGPEVDVWSLGVNMYAMLVGKLPFRSPRQGTKKRQKLLEQIQAGLIEGHQKEMAHVTREGQDLIGKLLETSSQRRVKLKEVMEHPWITKDGSQPLYPYKYIPPDQTVQHSVMELMSTVLEVSHSEIREAVRRDRCDWVAAIYNLLMDQPDGRVVLQRLLAAGPDEQLVDAAHYQGSMEHFRLSQGEALDQTPPDVAQAITASVAQGSHNRAQYRHSMSGPHPGIDYPSTTLPLTKHERKRHHSQEPRPLGAPRLPLNPVQPPPSMRRASIGSAQIHTPYKRLPGDSLSQPAHFPQPQELPPPSRGRRLPVTPNEEPFQHPSHEPLRPHSRAESEPNPLPIPWRPAIVTKNQLHTHGRGSGSGTISPIAATSPTSSPPHSRRAMAMSEVAEDTQPAVPQLISPLTQMGSKGTKKKSGGFLRPVRPISGQKLTKKISASMDADLDSAAHQAVDMRLFHSGSVSRKTGRHGHVGPMQPHDQQPVIGWPSHSQMGSLSRRSKDIQALMRRNLPTSPYHSVQDISALGDLPNGSVTSVDIKPELFSNEVKRISPQGSTRMSPHGSTSVSPHGSTTVSPHESMRLMSPEGSHIMAHDHTSPQHSRVIVKSYENLKMDPLTGGEVSQPKKRYRSVSANPSTRPYSVHGDQALNSVRDPRFDQPVPNGAIHPSEQAHLSHRPHPHHHHPHPHHHNHTHDQTDGRRSGNLLKQRCHTHSGSHPPLSQTPSHITEL